MHQSKLRAKIFENYILTTHFLKINNGKYAKTSREFMSEELKISFSNT